MTDNPIMAGGDLPPAILPRPDRWDLVRFVLFFLLSLLLSLVILVALAAVLSAGDVPRSIDALSPVQRSWVQLGLTAAAYSSLIFSVWFSVIRRGRSPALTLALKPVRWTVLVAAGLGMIVLSIVISVLASRLMQDVQPQMNEMFQGMTRSPVMIATAIFLIGLLAPIAEEMFFRGLLYNWLRAHFPFWVVALITSLLFGLSHGNLGYAFVAGLLGLALATLREYSGSLWTSIAAHAANNTFAVGIAMLAPNLV